MSAFPEPSPTVAEALARTVEACMPDELAIICDAAVDRLATVLAVEHGLDRAELHQALTDAQARVISLRGVPTPQVRFEAFVCRVSSAVARQSDRIRELQQLEAQERGDPHD